MILTIWRHGMAGDARRDFDRQLTVAGREDVSRGSSLFDSACRQHDLPLPDLILHSPWTRTTQTAAIIGGAFPDATVVPEEGIQPGAQLAAADAVVDTALSPDAEGPRHLLLVSHQPLVQRLAGHFLGDARLVPGLTPGALVTMALSVVGQGCADLVFWCMPPEYGVGR